MTNKDFFFCCSQVRPKNCTKETKNLCCFNCDDQKNCREKHKRIGSKPLPCNKDTLDEGEICEYMV